VPVGKVLLGHASSLELSGEVAGGQVTVRLGFEGRLLL
jgi:hypothetical protein